MLPPRRTVVSTVSLVRQGGAVTGDGLRLRVSLSLFGWGVRVRDASGVSLCDAVSFGVLLILDLGRQSGFGVINGWISVTSAAVSIGETLVGVKVTVAETVADAADAVFASSTSASVRVAVREDGRCSSSRSSPVGSCSTAIPCSNGFISFNGG